MTPEQRKYERTLVAILGAVQFTHILDFVVIMPMAPIFTRVLGIDLVQFGYLAASYMAAAASASFAAIFVLDRFPRKWAMLTCYAGFLLATLLCAVSTSYEMLLTGRILAGIFGGVAGSVIFAILGDEIPVERRGRATGVVMSAFALASVLGLPIGLHLAAIYDWHIPFFIVLLVGVPVWITAAKILPPIDSHMTAAGRQTPVEAVKMLLRQPHHWWAILMSVMITSAGFLIIPMISPYMVKNVGFSEDQLSLIYLTGGIFTVFTARAFGKLADKYTPKRIFPLIALISIIPALALTHLPHIEIALALIVTTIFMIMMNGRFTVYMTLMTSITRSELRAGFMSLNSFFYQMAMALCITVAGHIVVEGEDGLLHNFGLLGWLSAGFVVAAILLVPKIPTQKVVPKV